MKKYQHLTSTVALAEWLRRVPAKYMGFPRESSNLSGDVINFGFFKNFKFSFDKISLDSPVQLPGPDHI